MRAIFAAGLTVLWSHGAMAGDWRYCLAPSRTDHKIYVSIPFPTDAPGSDAESNFAQRLAASGVRYDEVQCPRGDGEAAMRTMQQHAISMNRERGNQVISIDWMPAN